MDTSIQGTFVLVLRLSLKWRIHCIMFVSLTSVEWTPLFRGHLAWPWGYPLTLLLWRIHCIMFVSVTSVKGTPLFRGHLAWSWVCLLKRHLFSGDTWPSWSRVCLLNGRSTVLWMGVFRVPPGLYQNQVKCSAFDMEMIFILMQIKLFFTWMVVHLVSFCQWGFLELGIGQFVGERKKGCYVKNKVDWLPGGLLKSPQLFLKLGPALTVSVIHSH